MSSFHKKLSLQSISLIVLIALLCNAVVFNILEKPKIAKALGDEWATIGHFFAKIGEILWEIGVKVKDWAWERIKDIWQKKISSQDWWWERAKDAAQLIARKLQASLLKKITNNLADVIEGKDTLDGFKKYVEDFKKDIFWDAIAEATNQFSQELAGIDLCSPLGLSSTAEAKVVINPPLSDRLATTMSCSRKQMGQNLKNFYESFEGGWGSWLNVTQPNQNFAGSYLLALDAKIDLANKNTQANVAQVTANAGWRSNEQCDEWFNQSLNLVFSRDSAVSGRLTTQFANQPVSVIDYVLHISPIPPSDDTLHKAAGIQHDSSSPDADVVDLCKNQDQAKCSNPQDGFCAYNIKECRSIDENILLSDLGFACTKKSVKSPGQLIGQSFTKAVNWESDWLLSSTEISSAISILADAAINRFMREGVDAVGKAKTKIANIFGSDAKAVEANQAACRKRSATLDRNACLKCAYIDPKQLEFQACFNNEKQRLMMAPAPTGQINDANLSADMTQIGLLNQAIELKEKVSRALQSMGGASYYSTVRNPLKNLQYLSKCRWQVCAGAEIRRFMIEHCKIDASLYDSLMTRNQSSKVLTFEKAIAKCDLTAENACLYTLNTSLASLCATYCSNFYSKEDAIKRCTENCLEKPPDSNHGYNVSPCLELSKREALGNDSNINLSYLTLGNIRNTVENIDTGAPLQKNEVAEPLTDPDIRQQTLTNLQSSVPQGGGTCLVDAAWLTGNKKDDSSTGDGGIIGRAEFYQKTPRFAGYDLVPGWWNYGQKITIEQKIKDLAKEIGQDSRLIQIHRDNICGTDSVCKTNFGIVNMSYEYADQCMAKCGDPTEKTESVGQTTAETCLTKCVNIDVFEKLAPTDITAMFTPYGLADSQTACVTDTTQSFETCVNTKMTAACSNHCAKVNTINSNIAKSSCENFCQQRQPLGLCNDASEIPALACTKSSRYSRLGSMRIQQWDILAKQETVNGLQEVQDFLKNTLDVCPTDNTVPVPPATTDPDYAQKIIEYNATLYKYSENVIQKATAEQELSAEAKTYAKDLLNRRHLGTFSSRQLNVPYSSCKNIGLFIRDLNGVRVYDPPSNSARIIEAQLDGKDCPVTMLWLLWGTQQNYSYTDQGIQSCSNYNITNSDLTIACPVDCRIKFTGDQYRTLGATLDNEAQSQTKSLTERSTQTTSDGQAFGIDTSLIDELNSQLKFVNDNMDPRSLKQLNQNIIQALNEESCKRRICIMTDDGGRECDPNKIIWPGAESASQD